VAHASARGLSRRGHRITFFSAVGPVDPALAESGIEVICLSQHDMLGDPSRLSAAVRVLWNGSAQRRLAELLCTADRRRTIVHLHGWSKALSPSVLFAARRSGAATVQTLHDYVALCPNGAFYNYVTHANCGLTPMSAACMMTNCDARHYGHKAWRVARQAAAVGLGGGRLDGQDLIYLSEKQRQVIAGLIPGTATLHHVANPVDVDDRGPVDVAANDGFVFIGRLSAEKGVLLFAEAARRLGVTARFVGEGPLHQEIRRAVPEAAITGWVTSAEVEAEIRNARAVVFPSVWYETFGLSVYEALAHGVPAVVSDNTASAAAIIPQMNGLLFRSGSVEALAEALDTLRDPAVAGRMALAAYHRYWADPLTLERHVDRLEDTYCRIIERRLRGAVPRQ
jgi:glycosyltransferase involved in cell wall biosynthesis